MYQLRKAVGYKSLMSLRDTEKAIKLLKDTFEHVLADNLGLERISAPMLVATNDGINDDLNGVERPVRFDVKEISDYNVEVVHSLAKWKRIALHNYGFAIGEGLYTDMNAIRRDDDLDNTHSIYVDQWDWEKVISKENRNIEFLKETVRKIVHAIKQAELTVKKKFSCISTNLCEDVFFITSQELEDLYPTLSPKDRETEIVKEHKTVFIMQIGDILKSGVKHDGRAPDYDDWKLNGDLMFWNEVLNEPIELSSMGVRVDAETLKYQLEKSNNKERMKFGYHKGIINGELPLTIGGGIGQSRLCLLILQKLHIGEVQVAIWPKQMIDECRAEGINIL